MSVAAEKTETVCALRCGGVLYGVPAVSVCEVLEWRPPTTVPLAPPSVAGIIAYHGDVLTVIRLSSILHAPETSREAAMLVLEDPTTAERFALAIDSVEQVLPVSLSEVDPNPPALVAHLQPLFSGVSRRPGEPLILLNVSSLAPNRFFGDFEPCAKASIEGESCGP